MKIQSLSNFEVSRIAPLTIITMLSVTSPGPPDNNKNTSQIPQEGTLCGGETVRHSQTPVSGLPQHCLPLGNVLGLSDTTVVIRVAWGLNKQLNIKDPPRGLEHSRCLGKVFPQMMSASHRTPSHSRDNGNFPFLCSAHTLSSYK